jgi:hypothetical protein
MIFYELKINYTRQTGEDNPNGVNETYFVEGLTIADVEERLLSEIQRYISGDWDTKSCKQVQVYDYIANPEAEKWYKARVELITIDNDKETRKAVNVYAQANNITEANKAIHQAMGNDDFEVTSITCSKKLVDIIRAVK